MENNASKKDDNPVLEDEGVCTPLKAQRFDELRLVVIGIRGAGKNTIANAILGENIFTPLKVFKHRHIEAIRTVSGRRIRLSRTKGWRGELKSRRTKQAIVHCVQTLYDTGPHAVLLVLNVDSVLSESTMSTLEDLLTVQLWQHTIVVFTQVEKLGDCSIEDHIRCQQLQPLIDKCGGRHLEIGKNGSNQIVEKIEELIATKNSTSFLKMSDQKDADVDTLLKDKKYNLKHIIKNEHNITAEIKAKDADIERFKKIVRDKESKIASLRSNIGDRPNLSPLLRKIKELEHQVKVKNEKIKNKENEIEELKAKLRGSALRTWSETLLEILNELRDNDLKKMKYYICHSTEFRIPQSSLESKDRVDLANLMLEEWGEQQSILITRELMKKISRNDDKMIELFTPFLNDGGT